MYVCSFFRAVKNLLLLIVIAERKITVLKQMLDGDNYGSAVNFFLIGSV